MVARKKKAKIILSVVIGLILILFTVGYYFLNFNQTISRSGSLNLPGLKKPVEVLTDKYGIPHIKANNDHDMMMALGFIMASDRLWQMDLLRRIGSGRLSEILGPKLLETDIFLRKIRLRSHMVEKWSEFKKSAPEHMLMQIEAYFKGVNAYVKKGPRPLEMKILGYHPDEFTIEDALSVAGYMSLSFAEGFFIDILYTDLLNDLPKAEVDLLFPRAQFDDNLPDVSSVQISPENQDYIYTTLFDVVSELKTRFGLFQGSNSWVLSPRRTESGHTILANDPHIAYANPSVFYEAHIQSPTYENYGHYIPLIPFPGLGHNKDRAWAITMSNSDELDYFEESFHPTEPKVLYKNKYVPYKVVIENIKVKGQKDVHEEKVIITPHGPVIDGTRFVKKGKPLSVTWQFLNETNNPALSFYLLSQSKELKDLAPALSHTAAPGFNISFVDSKGNIGWHVMGKIPVLPKDVNGRSVRVGSTGQDEYLRYLDIMENPHIYNPESGVIVTANYKHQTEGIIPWIGLWQPKDRVLRLEALLDQKEKWSLEDLKTVQTDEHVTFYKSFAQDFLTEVEPKTELEKQVLAFMQSWDGRSARQDLGPSVYYTLSLVLLKKLILDELGQDRFRTYCDGADAFAFLFQILKRKDSILWDDITTSDTRETSTEIINQTFTESVAFLKQKLGTDMDGWHWDRLNHVQFNHVLGKFFPLDKIFNLGPYPVAGGTNQVNSMGAVKYDLSFDVFYGPAARRLIDYKDPSKSWGVLPTGNSGHRGSKHFSDQVELLINNKYREQNMNFDDLEEPVQKLKLNSN
jgi:penicillin amidase